MVALLSFSSALLPGLVFEIIKFRFAGQLLTTGNCPFRSFDDGKILEMLINTKGKRDAGIDGLDRAVELPGQPKGGLHHHLSRDPLRGRKKPSFYI